MKRLTPVFLFLFCLVSYAAVNPLAPQGAPGGSKPSRAPEQARQPRKVEQLNKEQFDRLADDEVIDIKGTKITAGEIRAKLRQAEAEAPARQKAAAEKAKAEFEAYRAKFLQEEKTKLEAENAKARAEAERWKQQHPQPTQQQAGAGQPAASAEEDAQLKAIRQEARQLLERSKNAPPAELEKIEQRAGELLRQLEQRKGPAGPPGKAAPKIQPPLNQTPPGSN